MRDSRGIAINIGNLNVVLIGMPAAGKTVLGRLLAERLSRQFIDTDEYIQESEGRSLETIIDEEEITGFLTVEERYVLSLNCHSAVIATGGSVVYGSAAMSHLQENGIIVYLFLPLTSLESKLTDMKSRGVVITTQQTLESLFEERDSLYRRYAEIMICCEGKARDQLVSDIVLAIEQT